MKYKIKEYSIWEIGSRSDGANRCQEDSMYPPHNASADDDRVFVLCDGMGGANAGDVASSTVCKAISQYISAQPQPDEKALQNAISNAYNALDALHAKDPQRLGTTLAALLLCDTGYVAAHIGDTAIYHIRPGVDMESTRIMFRTEDHSLVNHLVRKGEMTPEEALTSPKRHIITRAMQPNMQRRCRADFHSGADIMPGDFFMLCTAGMLTDLTDENICAIFSNDGGSMRNKMGLLTKATARVADNHSAIIVQILDVTGKSSVRKPATATKNTSNSVPMDRTNVTHKAEEVTSKAKDFVKKHQEKGDTGSLFIKFLFAVMGVVVLIMMVYYIFIRQNETLQPAGTAIDGPMVTPDGQYINEDEQYGYEITEQDKKNEAQQIAPEYSTTAEEVIEPETSTPATEAEPTQAPPEPAAANDEPILQL